MSNYIFAPGPAREEQSHPFVTWVNGFSPAELSSIEAYCEKNLVVSKGSISGKTIDEDYGDIRRSQTGWISNNAETGWFYDRMAFITRSLNAQFYRFDLYGFQEDFQYTVYTGDDEGHYDWHIDPGVGNGMTPRKLSLVLQLSDPDEYEGGELQFMTSSSPTTVRKEKGFVAAFPSYTLHRVTPVLSGVRKTIVVWVTGPAFR